MIRSIVLCTVLAYGLIPAQLHAQCSPDCNSSATTAGGSIYICPAGDGQTLGSVGAAITVTAMGCSFGVPVPIPGILATDFWLIDWSAAQGLALCAGFLSSNADGPTDMNGVTTMSGTISAGGCADGVSVIIQGIILKDPATSCTTELCLPINVRGLDLNGDLIVNVLDFSIFATHWPPGPYLECADFNFDGIINLLDFSIFATHFGHDC